MPRIHVGLPLLCVGRWPNNSNPTRQRGGNGLMAVPKNYPEELSLPEGLTLIDRQVMVFDR
jgi:hypothetical protein